MVLLPILALSPSRTEKTSAFAFGVDIEVESCKRMASNAVGLSHSLCDCRHASSYIGAMRNRLKMFWIYAMTHSAEMIDLTAFRNLALVVLVRDYVGEAIIKAFGFAACHYLRVSSILFGRGPLPTLRLWINLNLSYEPFVDRSDSHITLIIYEGVF